MSYTNLQILTMALRKAGLCDETLSPSTAQQTNGLTTMNAYLAMRDADGLRLGWFPQTNVNANAPLRDEYVYPVALLMARQLASDSGQPIQDDDLKNEINAAEALLAKLCREYFESDLSELSRAQAGPWAGPGWSLL